jgi:hypothetical protein
MSFACEDHRNAVFVGTGDDLIVFLRAARLNYCRPYFLVSNLLYNNFLNSSTVIPVCRMIALKVPFEISLWSGTVNLR